MTAAEPTPGQMVYYDGILQGAVARYSEDVHELITDYYNDDPIAMRIGLASGEVQLRPAFVNGPTGEHIRIEFGTPHEHDHYATVPNPLHESETE